MVLQNELSLISRRIKKNPIYLMVIRDSNAVVPLVVDNFRLHGTNEKCEK